MNVDPDVHAAYVTFDAGRFAETRVIIGLTLIGDYDRQGRLLGLERLGTVSRQQWLGAAGPAHRRAALDVLASGEIADFLGDEGDTLPLP